MTFCLSGPPVLQELAILAKVSGRGWYLPRPVVASHAIGPAYCSHTLSRCDRLTTESIAVPVLFRKAEQFNNKELSVYTTLVELL